MYYNNVYLLTAYTVYSHKYRSSGRAGVIGRDHPVAVQREGDLERNRPCYFFKRYSNTIL